VAALHNIFPRVFFVAKKGFFTCAVKFDPVKAAAGAAAPAPMVPPPLPMGRPGRFALLADAEPQPGPLAAAAGHVERKPRFQHGKKGQGINAQPHQQLRARDAEIAKLKADLAAATAKK